MKRLLILCLMVLTATVGFSQARPSFDQIAPGVGKFSDGTAAAPSITFGSDPDTGIYRYGANAIGFSSGNIGKMYLNTTGTVATPTTQLVLTSVDGTKAVEQLFGQGTNYLQMGIEGAASGERVSGTLANQGYLGMSSISDLVLLSGGNAAMTLKANRNVLIGTTTDDGVSKLQVNGDGLFAENILHYTGTAQKAGTKKGGSSFLDVGSAMVTEIGASDYYTCGDLVITSTTSVHVAKISLVGSVVVLDSYRGNTTATKDTADSVNIYVENDFINIQNTTAIPLAISYVFQGTWTE